MFEILSWQAWVTLGVILLMLVALVREVARPDLIMLGSLGVLLAAGILTPAEAFAGLSNEGVLTVAALFVVAAGVQNSGALSFFDRMLLPRTARVPLAVARLMAGTAVLSAFLNNTPIVAMLIPRVQAWCEQAKIPPSKLMIPLSYASIVGGMTTLIGTSTNLLVAGLMVASGYEPLGLFDLTWVGVPAALGVIAYFGLVGYRLLPDRERGTASMQRELADCLFEVRMTAASPLVGKTVEQAGLRALGDAYLVHLRRGREIVPSAPERRLQANDVLTFRGRTAALDRLLEVPGLERAMPGLEAPAHVTLPLYEAVVAEGAALVGKTLRDVDFRENYHGVVLGIHRRDAALEGPLGRIPIQAGDLLLVEARNGFDKRWNEQRDEFYLVAPHRPERLKPQPRKAPLALLILLGVVLLAAFEVAPIVLTAFLGALAMIGIRCLRGREARQAVDMQVLIVIAAALGISKAIENTGLSDAAAHLITDLAGSLGVVAVVTVVYVATSILTEIITNNAAAALMLVVGLSAADRTGAPPEALAVAVAIAASASFLTPIGYQTNLMVMAAGGYRFSDYFRSGALVNLIVAVIAILMIWVVWL